MSAQQTDLFAYAEQRMNQRFLAGEKEEAALIEQVAKTVIVDRLVPPSAMVFGLFGGGPQLSYSATSIVRIHRHALGQLCQKVGFPMSYANALVAPPLTEQWRQELLCYNLNELYHKPKWEDRAGAPVRFLNRVVGDELRGFLSRKYNRHLSTAPLLRSFIDASRKAGARPISARTSPVRMQLLCLLPNVFEAYPGEAVSLGVSFSNSDFGAGRLTVKSTIWRINSGTVATLDESLSKVHVGSILEDSDLVELSNETAQKEVVAQRGFITDVVTQLLAEKTVDRLLQMLRAAHDQQIPWTKLKGRLSAVLSKADLNWLQQAADDGSTIVDLPAISFTPDGERVPNAYWAAAALSAVAARTDDADKKMELEQEAGKLLSAAA